MEYRVSYRDLPWSVALGVLPGKIIGTFIIKPFNHIRKSSRKFIIKFLIMLLAVSILFLIFTIIQQQTDGTFLEWMIHIKDSFFGWLTSDAVAKDAADTVMEMSE